MAEKDINNTLKTFFNVANLLAQIQKKYKFDINYRLVKNIFKDKNHYLYYSDKELDSISKYIKHESYDYI